MIDAGHTLSEWTNGVFTIRWLDRDQIEITKDGCIVAIMYGGDFEYVLIGLGAAYRSGQVYSLNLGKKNAD